MVKPAAKLRFKKYTASATAVKTNEKTKPVTCLAGNSSLILHHSFQIDEAENENPDYI